MFSRIKSALKELYDVIDRHAREERMQRDIYPLSSTSAGQEYCTTPKTSHLTPSGWRKPTSGTQGKDAL